MTNDHPDRSTRARVFRVLVALVRIERVSVWGGRSRQMGLWEADQLYLNQTGEDTPYGLLASLRSRLFRDANFAEQYCLGDGRVIMLGCIPTTR